MSCLSGNAFNTSRRQKSLEPGAVDVGYWRASEQEGGSLEVRPHVATLYTFRSGQNAFHQPIDPVDSVA